MRLLNVLYVVSDATFLTSRPVSWHLRLLLKAEYRMLCLAIQILTCYLASLPSGIGQTWCKHCASVSHAGAAAPQKAFHVLWMYEWSLHLSKCELKSLILPSCPSEKLVVRLEVVNMILCMLSDFGLKKSAQAEQFLFSRGTFHEYGTNLES